MGTVTTHTEGRVVTHSGDDAGGIEVVQLPARDAAMQAAAPAATPAPATPAPTATAATTPKTARPTKAAKKR